MSALLDSSPQNEHQITAQGLPRRTQQATASNELNYCAAAGKMHGAGLETEAVTGDQTREATQERQADANL